jgi:hypothetical protein
MQTESKVAKDFIEEKCESGIENQYMENHHNFASEALDCSCPARKSKRDPSTERAGTVNRGLTTERADKETRQPISPVPSAKKKKKEETEITTVAVSLYPIVTELTAPALMLQNLIGNGKESDDQIDQINRRERNKDHSKRARLKKKSLFLSLQSTIQQLRLENEKLASAIRENIPDGHNVYIEAIE